ncbi:MAG TPA: pyridoxal-phosphate dependent enzyme, partial [Methylomirabilota bacterium]|nr:pyridoxal-phosphate dependent enzyme [Methylomirabilota bacterium]
MFVTHIECTVCGQRHEAGRLLTVCQACGQMLAVRYDLPRAALAVSKETLRSRPPGMYRFRELLPLAATEEPVTLGEGGTPLLALPRLAAHLGLRHLWAKDEGQNPTGTFKARGLGMAITKARTLGARGFMIPSAGNAGGAAAVYAARCGLPCAVIVPRGTPPAAIAEAAI